MSRKLKQTAFKQKQYDHLVKIVIIGNSGVGKTNILLRFVQQKYQIVHTPTIGVDFRSKIMSIPYKSGAEYKKIKLQIWDTAGQQRFRTLTDTYFKAVSGIIITYAVNDRKSFLDIKSWIIQLEQYRVQKQISVIYKSSEKLVQSKVDFWRMRLNAYLCRQVPNKTQIQTKFLAKQQGIFLIKYKIKWLIEIVPSYLREDYHTQSSISLQEKRNSVADLFQN